MNRCLVCFGIVEETLNKNHLCKKCIDKLECVEQEVLVDGVKTLILYKYNDFFKEILYRYKGCYDIELKEVFLTNFFLKLSWKYRGRKVICAPSYYKEDLKRGFNHVKEIAKLLDFEIIDCLKKSKNYKQSNQKYNERSRIENIIKIDKTKLKGVKKVLIVDDVTTSLATLKTIIRLLPTNIDIKALILSSNCRFMTDEFV